MDKVTKGADKNDAWNQVQYPFVRRAALAYGELFIFNEYLRIGKRCKYDTNKEVLKKFRYLFGLNILESDPTLYELGYMDHEDMKYVREEMRRTCAELKQEIIGVVDALAPPDQLLGAPIGASDGDIYNKFINTMFTAPKTFEKASYWELVRENIK